MNILRGKLFDTVVVVSALFMITTSVNVELAILTSLVGEQRVAGLSAMAFSSYVVGLIPTLILCAGISDRLGRVPVLIAATFIAGIAVWLLIVVPNIVTLMISRALRGVAIGFALGASAAFLIEAISSRSLAANIHGIAVTLGLGGGALATVLMPVSSPLGPLFFNILVLWSLMNMILLMLLKDSTATSSVSLVRLPAISRDVWDAYLGIFVAWSFVGVMITLVSRQVAAEFGALGFGLTVFLAVGLGAFAQPFCRGYPWRRVRMLGIGTVLLAFVILIFGVVQKNTYMLLAAAALCGPSCLGLIYLSGIERVLSVRSSSEARLVSGYFLCGYIGLGGPCIAVGIVADTWGEINAILGFSVFLAVMIVVISIWCRTGKRTEELFEAHVIREKRTHSTG